MRNALVAAAIVALALLPGSLILFFLVTVIRAAARKRHGVFSHMGAVKK